MRKDVVVIGAGLAGLSCARRLADAGASVTVLERAKGVGGRCATRHVDGMPIDFGVVFFHGSDPAFVKAVETVHGASVLEGWPLRRHDTGRPCQPDAFAATEKRLAYVEGVSVLPKSLARGLDVELQAEVMTLAVKDGAVHIHTSQDKHYEAGTVVLALAPEQTRRLLESLPHDEPEVTAAREMLGLFASVRCVTLLAGYQRWSPEPPWDVSYPSESPVLALISNESTKRPERKVNAIVYQASPRWSRAHFDEPVAELEHAIIAEASRLLGPWAGEPAWTQVHQWRYARLDRGNELASPLLLSLAGGTKLGIAGEIFAPGGGLEAAFASGTALARRLLEEPR